MHAIIKTVEKAPDDGEDRSVEPGPEKDSPKWSAAKAIGNLGGLSVVQTVGGFSKIIPFQSSGLMMEITRSGYDASSTCDTLTRQP